MCVNVLISVVFRLLVIAVKFLILFANVSTVCALVFDFCCFQVVSHCSQNS